MRAAIIVAVIAIIGVGAFIFTSPKAGTTQTTDDNHKFDTVQQDVKSGALLLDVRTAGEYGDGHFAGATNFPVQDMVAGKLPSVAKDTKIYLYCLSGNRAGQAAMLLKSAGFTNVAQLGGLSDVEKMGGTLQK